MLQIRVLQILVLQIRVLQILVLQIRVLQILVLQIQSMFYKSNPVRVLQYAISNNIYDTKTTLIFNPEYKKLRSPTNILGDFCYCTFGCTSKSAKSKVTSDSEGAVMKLPRCVYSRNSVKSSFDTDTGFLFCKFPFSFKCYKVRQEMCEFNTKITIAQFFRLTVKTLPSKTRLFIAR